MRVLVVEDEVRLARNIKRGLESQPSFVVDLSHDGDDGEHLILTNDYDLVILDLMLPGKSGLEVLQSARAAGKQTAILILTARNTKEDIVRGLDFGSDDYLAKPFEMGELIARVKALIRRSHGRADSVLRVHDLEIDTRRHIIRRSGKELPLPALEYRLLEYLAHRSNEIVSKTELLEHLYDYNWEKFSNVVEVYVSGLRRKIEAPGLPKLIHTIRGQGYLLGLREGESDST
jgi:two-component system response regulator PhoP